MSVPYREGPVRKVMSAMVFREEPLAEVRPTDPCVDLTPMALPFLDLLPEFFGYIVAAS